MPYSDNIVAFLIDKNLYLCIGISLHLDFFNLNQITEKPILIIFENLVSNLYK